MAWNFLRRRQLKTPELSPGIAADLNRMIDRESVRAVTIGLYDNGKSEFVGFGRLSDDDTRQPDGSTVFEIGSISKVFTSLLVQVQVEAKNLDWDQSIASYLPDINFASPEVAAITLRELSTHTSGLPRLPNNMKFANSSNPYAGYTRRDLLSFVSSYKPDSLAKEYEYSNLGAGLLGVIAADASNSNYADAMKRNVLTPLGLGDTHAGLRTDLLDRLAIGFSDSADMPNWDGSDALAGAGALVSTANDMLLFVHHSLNNTGTENTITAIQRRQNEGPTALGWHIHDLDEGETMLWHNGGTGGYASFLAIRPDTGTAVVILATSTEYESVTELGFAQITGSARTKNAADVDAYLGTYKLAEGFILTVFSDDGRLYAQATGQGAFLLNHESDDDFSYAPADIKVVFERDESGVVGKLTLLQAGNETLAPRVSDDFSIKRRFQL